MRRSLIAMALCAVAALACTLAFADSSDRIGVKCSDSKKGGTDTLNLTPKGGGTTPVTITIPPNTCAFCKMVLFRDAINATTGFTAVMSLDNHGGWYVQITDSLGRDVGISWNSKSGEQEDYVTVSQDRNRRTSVRLQVLGLPTGSTGDGPATLVAGYVGARVEFSTIGFLGLQQLRVELRDRLIAAGVPAVLQPDGGVTYEIPAGEAPDGGARGALFGTRDEGLELTIENEIIGT